MQCRCQGGTSTPARSNFKPQVRLAESQQIQSNCVLYAAAHVQIHTWQSRTQRKSLGSRTALKQPSQAMQHTEQQCVQLFWMTVASPLAADVEMRSQNRLFVRRSVLAVRSARPSSRTFSTTSGWRCCSCRADCCCSLQEVRGAQRNEC